MQLEQEALSSAGWRMTMLMVLLWDDGCVKSCVSPGPERCASSLSKSSPALWYHVFPEACSTLARTATLILPSGRSGNTCICQNGGNMEAREREREWFPQIWGVTLKKHSAKTRVDDWTVCARAFSCVNKDTADEKQSVMDCKSVCKRGGSSLGFGRNYKRLVSSKNS